MPGIHAVEADHGAKEWWNDQAYTNTEFGAAIVHDHEPAPVSYTHLDVYKRQDQCHPRNRYARLQTGSNHLRLEFVRVPATTSRRPRQNYRSVHVST